MKVLGITGGVGAGKSTILSYLEQTYDALVIQCDEEGRSVQMPGGVCYEPICRLLETAAPDGAWKQNDGTFDRTVLAALLFRDPILRKAVSDLVHPAVKASVVRKIQEAAQSGSRTLVVVEAALLLEDGYDAICDEIWYVYASENTRIRRLMVSRGYSRQKAEAIIASQMKEEAFRCACALTIDNDRENVQNTYDQIDKGLKLHGFLQYSERKQR